MTILKKVFTQTLMFMVIYINIFKFPFFQIKWIVFFFAAAKAPEIDFSNLEDEHNKPKSLGDPLRLECKFIGAPLPNIVWYKDNMEIIIGGNETRLGFFDNYTIFDIKNIKIEDQGEYKCEATNSMGTANRMATITISSKYCLYLIN